MIFEQSWIVHIGCSWSELNHFASQDRCSRIAFVLLAGCGDVVVSFRIHRQTDRPIMIVLGMTPAAGDALGPFDESVMVGVVQS